MNTVAVFTWKGELPADDEVGADPAACYSEDFGEQWAYQVCEPVARAILLGMRELGFETVSQTPDYDETGWYFEIAVDGRNYSIFVQWIVGKTNDHFAVEPSLRRGLIKSVLHPRISASELQPIREVLGQMLSAHPLVDELEWVREIP